ncbi:MAG: tetratricopeptide repeat protein [Candidatus Omnitrophica bacterium]|nr:tetratricopeptide repeat protein [Candidatus Omnitrophota bacterium]
MAIDIGLLRKLINRKTLLIIIPIIVLLEASVYFGIKTNKLSQDLKKQSVDYGKFSKENVELRDAYVKAQNDYDKLRKDYDSIALDRDNLLVQIKKNIANNNRLTELEVSAEEFKKEKEALIAKREEVLKQNSAFKQQIKALGLIKKQLSKEKEQLQAALEEQKAGSAVAGLERQNADLAQRLDLAQKEVERLKSNQAGSLRSAQDEITRLKTGQQSNLNQAQNEINKLRESEAKLKEKIEDLELREKELTKKYAEAVKKTQTFEKKVARDPAKFTEIARQNKSLIRNTATMHYNMGVFYLKQKEYSRAVAEFEKAVELTPDDAYSHFNLGYIYAEYLVNRAKAVEHFRQYLRLAKSDDKDVDWVKKYILTWETWGGKEPME